MRIISVDKNIMDTMCEIDPEMLLNKQGRPCLLVIKLRYNGRKYDFAVPFRSNIPPAEQKANYFALPPRHTTRPRHRHGLHFCKMFPIRKKYIQKFYIDNNLTLMRSEKIIQKNEKQIIQQAQAYLDKYSLGVRSSYATNIDRLLSYLEEIENVAAA